MSESAEGFEVFVAVVESGSISAAARARDEPRETVSRQLSRLEQRLGVRLLHRGTRRLVPTPAGEELYSRVRPLILAAREAEAAVRRMDDVPRGLLRISTPPGGATNLLSEVCLSYLRLYPQVDMEIIASSRHVDLVAEGYDVALRAGTIRDPNLVARQLWATDLIAVASPAYLDTRDLPQHPDELIDHTCVLGTAGGDRPVRRWPLRAGGTVAVYGRVASNDLGVMVDAALHGHGIALLPRPVISADLAAGRLIPVLPGVLGSDTAMAAVYVERAFLPAKVRTFVDHVADWFARGPENLQRLSV